MKSRVNVDYPEINESGREGLLNTDIQGLIFDFDGLVVDTETCMFRAWEALLSPYNIEVSPLMVAGLVGNSVPATDLYASYRQATASDISDQDITALLLDKAYQLIAQSEAREGIRDYLTFAKQQGWKIALATSSEEEHYLPILDRLGLCGFFDCFVGADQIELQRRKPQPDVYIEALNQLGIDADRALAFEDSPAGITAAKSAKITTVAVSNFLTRHLDLSAADKVLGSMAELTLTELVTEFNERKK